MKRTGNLFNTAFSQGNLYAAYLDARRGKRGKISTLEFEKHLGENLCRIYNDLHSGAYRPKPYFTFKVYEPKERLIYAPAFQDIVVQHAIYRIIYEIFNRTFVKESFACRHGFGTHRASDHVQQAMRGCQPDSFTLKLDIRKFFYSIDRTILRSLIERKIKDRRFVDVMMLFAEMDTPVGIPIGNLLSQLYALIYMNPLDHYVKRVLKIKHYVRYVDDFILIGLSLNQCLVFREMIVCFLKNNLDLSLSKSTVQTIRRGVNFVGYRTWRNRRFIRRYSLYKFKRAVTIGKLKTIASLLGHAKSTDSLPYMIDLIRRYTNEIIRLPKKRWINAAIPVG